MENSELSAEDRDFFGIAQKKVSVSSSLQSDEEMPNVNVNRVKLPVPHNPFAA